MRYFISVVRTRRLFRYRSVIHRKFLHSNARLTNLGDLLNQDPHRRIKFIVEQDHINHPLKIETQRSGLLGRLFGGRASLIPIAQELHVVPFWTSIFYTEALAAASSEHAANQLDQTDRIKAHFGASIAAVPEGHWCRGLVLPQSHFPSLFEEMIRLHQLSRKDTDKTYRLADPSPAEFAHGPPDLSDSQLLKCLQLAWDRGFSIYDATHEDYPTMRMARVNAKYSWHAPTYKFAFRYVMANGDQYYVDCMDPERILPVYIPQGSDRNDVVMNLTNTSNDHEDLIKHNVVGWIKLQESRLVNSENHSRLQQPMGKAEQAEIVPRMLVGSAQVRPINWQDGSIVTVEGEPPGIPEIMFDIFERFRGGGFSMKPLTHPMRDTEDKGPTRVISQSRTRIVPGMKPALPKPKAKLLTHPTHTTLSSTTHTTRATRPSDSPAARTEHLSSHTPPTTPLRKPKLSNTPQIMEYQLPSAMTDARGLYNLLGISPKPSFVDTKHAKETNSEIQRKFNDLIWQAHPDSPFSEKRSDRRNYYLKDVDMLKAARDSLSTLEKRRRYQSLR